ncbi:toxin PIN [Geodermatophilus sp. TF02-6]|nr:toxin PIN [Geodermatophilus sp. TF02-6]
MAAREGIDQGTVTIALDRLVLVDVDRALVREAGLLPGRNLHSLDALHVAAASRLDSEVFASYDDRQAAAARSAGPRVLAPS